MEKDTFLMRGAYRRQFAKLSMEERGQLITAILDYESGEDVGELSPLVELAFSFIKDDLDYNAERYEKKCETNRQNGAKGGRPKGTKKEEAPSSPNDEDATDTQSQPAEPAEPAEPPEQEKPANDFERFWEAYPKKVRKAAARRSWKAIKPDEDLTQTILKAIELAKASPQWTKSGGRFIPDPSRWIEEKRWEDQLSPALEPPRSYNIEDLERISHFDLPDKL